MKNLVIVESPTKARTLGRFLGKDYEIKASMGHIMDLPKNKLGVDEKTLEPAYEIVSEKRMAISDLKEGGRKADVIIIATDPDREGEAIASHVRDILASDKKLNIKNKKVFRIVFHEITKGAIEEALKNPRDIDQALVDAQTARRVLDRLVGYKISPVLWQKVRRGLSAGRVQSVALRLIVEREREIEKFKKGKYWTIHAVFEKTRQGNAEVSSKEVDRGPVPGFHSTPVKQANSSVRSAGARLNDAKPQRLRAVGSPSTHATPLEIEFELIEINGAKIEFQETLTLYDGQYKVTKTTLDKLEKTQDIVDDLKKRSFVVSDTLKKEVRKSPYPPYTTSTLQQDSSRRLGFPGRRTMSLAQKLYEEGFITYHRTDSVNMAGSAVSQLRKFVGEKFGSKYLSPSPRVYKTKQKLAQEAHEAIRPTDVDVPTDKIEKELGRDFAKLYDLIWTRAVATQMADAVIESTSVFATTSNKQQLTSNNSVSSQKSALPVGRQEVSSYRFRASGSVLIFDGFLKVAPQALSENILPDFKTGESLTASEIFEKEHETLPPPRYNEASLIKALEDEGIGRPSTYATIVSTIEGRRYVEKDTPAGGGRFEPTPVGVAVNDFLVSNFSTIDDIPFTASMEDELDAVANEKRHWKPMIKDFYENLTKTLNEVKEVARVKIEAEEIDEKCPDCGSPLVLRYGKFGKFLSCSTFPKCKFTKPYVEEIGIPCPKCKTGQVITRKTRKGRTFYGCSNYPNCDFAAWKLEDVKKYSN